MRAEQDQTGHPVIREAVSGLDGLGRIIGVKGKRPVIRNIPREAVDHFRCTVYV